MKKSKKIILGIVIFIAILVAGGVVFLGSSLSRLDEVPVVNLEDVTDGTYEGSEETPLVKVTVKVEVQDHKISDIQLVRHQNGKGESAEAMIPEMISQNTSEVDEVSVATMSSKTIRAAVRNALAKGVQK